MGQQLNATQQNSVDSSNGADKAQSQAYIYEGGSKNLINLITFVIFEICYRWIRHDLRIIFLKADCKTFDLSFHDIVFHDYLSMEMSGKFLGNFREILRSFKEMFRYDLL